MSNSFYDVDELAALGLLHVGKDVKISRRASLFNPQTLSIGDFSRIDDFCILTGHIVIGRNVHIAAYSGLFGAQPITMEDFSSVSSRVTIYSESDDYFLGSGLTNPTVPGKYRKIYDKGPVKLGRHSMVGCGCVILPNLEIGEGATIGALSLVRRSLPPWTINSGNPAKKIGSRKKTTILQYEDDYLSS